ncbi:MAG: NTP transferase domain-containing protein [Candidatus Lokiarchaeota archaeon]|nr:NTP transferase domain-containing protein [Candidatus Lokiarchaeota archaeon]MBD3339951.1 NTP transferase domain-containing protein [Candidatus Lokiarchaeota archaeon]
MTKGIILSGGWGTRLRPLTCTVPKTLIPVVNKPVIERQMLLLKEAGIKEVVLAVSVMAEELKRYFGNGEKLGLKIHYTNEKNPMGTAGAIKLAESYLNDDNFFMLNGDVILNFDFSSMLRKHTKYGGIGTIASIQVEDPSRYGVLIIEREFQKILKFLEKNEYNPPEGNIAPMPVNAGVYILEPEIFTFIPPRKKVSIERDVFPTLAREKKLHHYPISGIWKDIGKPEELLEGNILLMKNLLESSIEKKNNLIEDSVQLDPGVKIIPPCTIGTNTIIKKNSVIGPNAIIGDNVYVDTNSEIKDALIYSEAYISSNVHISRSIISDNCNIREGAILKGNNDNLVILASSVDVLKNIKLIAPLHQSVSICHHEVVKDNVE